MPNFVFFGLQPRRHREKKIKKNLRKKRNKMRLQVRLNQKLILLA